MKTSLYTTDFEQMIREFESIAKIPSWCEQQYILSRSAAFWGITRAEARRLFKQWRIERSADTGSSVQGYGGEE